MNYIDQMGRSIYLKTAPQRIVSVVPSQTELLYYLGLDQEVVGITKFCTYPDEWFRAKERVGGTKQLNLDKIQKLAPDLIIANKEENSQADIEALMKLYPVWISDILDIKDSLEMIERIGVLVQKTAAAQTLVKQLQSNFAKLKMPLQYRPKIAYLIWRKPWMTVASDTFIDSMLTAAGFENVFAEQQRYPTIEVSDLQKNRPDFIFLSSEPYPFKEKHIAEWKDLFPEAPAILVNGELFSWYGSRLLASSQYLKELHTILTTPR